MAKVTYLEHVSDELAERTAHIIGPSGAYALVLEELRSRRARGEDAHIFKIAQTVLVGPWPTRDEQDAARFEGHA